MSVKERAYVLSQDMCAEGIFSLVLRVSFAGQVCPGQFVSLFTDDKSRLLPRPISVCGADADEGSIRLVYRVAGFGTEYFSRLQAEDAIEVMGPLGNGFPLELAEGKRVLLVGGGIGIPPMLSCAEALAYTAHEPVSVTCAAGYRSSDTYLLEELEAVSEVIVATDDGSLGTHGTVIDAVRENGVAADIIFACGPKPMLRAVKAFAAERGIPCFVSLEERMACGVGACLGCVAKTERPDPHSLVKNARVCADGPVFDAKEVDLT